MFVFRRHRYLILAQDRGVAAHSRGIRPRETFAARLARDFFEPNKHKVVILSIKLVKLYVLIVHLSLYIYIYIYTHTYTHTHEL